MSPSGIFLVWTRRMASRPLHVGTAHHHAAVETARPQQRRVEHVGPVGGGHQDHAFVRFEAVHLHQQLVQGLLALVVPAAQTRAAMAAHGVDFIDEDDAGSVLLALLEQVAHAARAHADEHFHEVRTGDREERHAGFAGDGARQQRLAGSRRADQQHAFGNAAAQFLELLRLAQELDNLLQFFLGLFHAGHVLERDLLLLRGMQARAALAEAQRLVAAALHLAHHENPESDQHDKRRGVHQDGNPVAGILVLDRGRHAFIVQHVVKCGVVGRYGGVIRGSSQHIAVYVTAVNGRGLDLSVLYLGQEVGKRELRDPSCPGCCGPPQTAARHANQNYPKNNSLDIRIHETSVSALLA